MFFSDKISDHFKQIRLFNTNARKLITVNLLFGLFNPFYLVFSNTFIFNATKGNIEFNLLFCILSFIGISAGFVLNGYMVRVIPVHKQMVTGAAILLSALAALFLLPKQFFSSVWVLFFGFLTGIGNGIYWSSRNFLTLMNTNESNRDFYTGLDFILISFGRILTPLLIGLYIGETIKYGIFDAELAYRTTLVFGLILVGAIAFILWPRKFRNVTPSRFLFFNYSTQWMNARLMTLTWGMFNGMFIALPPYLIMKYIGNETIVGTINSVCYIIAIIIVYWISRKSDSSHRTRILRYGIYIQLVGVLLFLMIIPINVSLATSFLILGVFFSDPVVGFPFRATFMKAIEIDRQTSGRDSFAYVVDIEIWCAIGRIISLLVFFLLINLLPEIWAFAIYMVILVVVQFKYIPYSKRINGV